MENKIQSFSKSFSIAEFFPKEALEEIWEAYFDLSEGIFSEFNEKRRLPDRGVVRRLFSTTNPLYTARRWLVFSEAQQVVAYARMSYDTELSPDFEINKHIYQVQISVAEAFRGKKIASMIIKYMNGIAKEMGKETLMADVNNPIGIKFCRYLKGQEVLEELQQRLYLEDIDWKLAKEWAKKAKAKSPHTTTDLFQDCPESDIDEFCRVYTETINQRPTGGMEQEIITSPESRRIEERNLRKRGIEYYTMICREQDGRISALTDIMYNPEEPYKVNQYFTGVLDRYRRKGLAKRLKVEMLFVIRDKFPDVEYIRTMTAKTNQPMLAINRSLGFQPTKTCIIFQWALPDLEKRLDEILQYPEKPNKIQTTGRI